MSTNCFTQKCECFQSHSDKFFLFLKHYYEVDDNKWQNVNCRPYHEPIFMKQNFSGNFSFAPPKKYSPVHL